MAHQPWFCIFVKCLIFKNKKQLPFPKDCSIFQNIVDIYEYFWSLSVKVKNFEIDFGLNENVKIIFRKDQNNSILEKIFHFINLHISS
jgi:hypothetical protein